MTQENRRFGGLRTCIYLVDDMEKAIAWYSKILEQEPYFNEPFYVGYEVAGYELGLQPASEGSGTKGDNVATYWAVEEIEAEYQRLLDLGAKEREAPHEVGGGIWVATVFDPWENLLGIIHNPHFGTQAAPAVIEPSEEPMVTGLGGIFFKSEDPAKLRAWYEEHLGIITDKYGTSFEWKKSYSADAPGFTAWSPFLPNSDYYDVENQRLMINYRVQKLEELLHNLKAKGVKVADKLEEYEYGKFSWIWDLEGNKVELWEPNDSVYDKMIAIRMKSH